MSSTMLEMEHKEREIEELLQDGDARDAEHAAELKQFHAEIEDALAARDEMQEVRWPCCSAMNTISSPRTGPRRARQ